MNISQHGLDFIASFEGGMSSDGLFHAYWDPWGRVWTIGYGNTANVHAGMTWTKTRAEAELRRSLEGHYELVIDALGVPLTQNQYDSLCSFVWNLGPGSMQWDVGRYLHQREYRAAADAMLQYDRAGGQVLSGLVRRRQAERALFLQPDVVADPHHYLEYPTREMYLDGHAFHERHLAEEIDRYLHHPHLHRHKLVRDLSLAVEARKRIWVVSVLAPPDYKTRREHADWGDGRGPRYQWWSHRIEAVEHALDERT